jgi:hypothetical protein
MTRGDQLQRKMYLLLSLESGQTINFIFMYSSMHLFSRGNSIAHFAMLRLEAESDSDFAAQSRWYVTRRIR